MTAQRPPVAAPPVPKSKVRRISPAKWAEIESAWTQGKFATLADIAAHFKEPVNSLHERFKAKKLRRGQAIEDYNRKVQDELQKKAEQEARLLAERIAETREEHYKMATGISKLTWAEILSAKQAGAPMSSVKNNLASLESAMKILKLAREERFAVLGLDDEGKHEDDDEIPELLVNELTAEQMEEMRHRAVSDDDDVLEGITVIGDDADLEEDDAP